MGEIADLYSYYDDEFEEQDDVECNQCGTDGLHWEETKNGWRLFDDEGLHRCPVTEFD